VRNEGCDDITTMTQHEQHVDEKQMIVKTNILGQRFQDDK
jgi:hypothetical protein